MSPGYEDVRHSVGRLKSGAGFGERGEEVPYPSKACTLVVAEWRKGVAGLVLVPERKRE